MSIGVEWPAIGSAPVLSAAPLLRNRLLAALTQGDFDDLRPHLTQVGLVSNQILFGPGEVIEHVYFVEQGVVSLVADTGADDMGIEVGMIGREGMAGIASVISDRPIAFHHTRVQMPGSALRMPVACFQRLLGSVPALRERCLRYLDAFVIQVAQTGACNGRHHLPERCACWLLTACDRAEDHEMPLTHDMLSAALGVRRSGITTTVGALQDAGLVRSGRGKTVVLDHAGLERAACSCYRLVRNQFDQLLACP
jgi:CRP-like cAMP-binding protein